MAFKFNKKKDRDIFNTGFFEGFRVASTGQVEAGWAPPGVEPSLDVNLAYLKNEHFQRDFAAAAVIGFEAGLSAVKGLKEDDPRPSCPDLSLEWSKAIGEVQADSTLPEEGEMIL